MKKVQFAYSAFKHGLHEEDFFELLSGEYLKIRSQRGIRNVYELLGRNQSGDYIHAIYRVLLKQEVIRVFHMNHMTEPMKRRFKEIIRK